MPKRLANGLTLLSAVVCVGSAMLVGRSLVVTDAVTLPYWPDRQSTIVLVDGTLVVTHISRDGRFEYGTGRARVMRRHLVPYRQKAAGIPWMGFGWGRMDRERYLFLPLWLLPLLTAIPPVRWWRARRREGGRGFAVDGADHGVRAHGTRADGTGAGDAD